MALIDIVKFQGNDEEFVWKFPSENLRWGTQLVVKPGQTAFFVKGGKILDEIREGTVTLKTGNIPLLTKLMSLPFGGDTPFQAEVWFVNLITKLNTPWGTIRPVQLEDPKYGVVVPVRAFGQYGFRVSEPRNFLETIVGTAKVFTALQITDYFDGVLLQAVTSNIGKAVVRQNVSVLQISAYLDDLSGFCKEKIAVDFQKFGLELINFYFQSINVPEDDESFIKLKQIKEKAAELNVVGRDIYQMDKSMDVLKTAAGNQGMAGLMMQTGMGSGMGVMMGAQLGAQAGQMMSQLPAAGFGGPPPIPSLPAVQFHVVINGQQLGPFPLALLQQMITTGTFSASSLVWRQGMVSWQVASTVQELVALFAPAGPPPVPPVA
ncbi:MAG: SPFH domain-containing protein [Verrucomicrobia bacterium]|nr:SPFH domain-containing protein [Verrucomicrobiota bacterium]